VYTEVAFDLHAASGLGAGRPAIPALTSQVLDTLLPGAANRQRNIEQPEHVLYAKSKRVGDIGRGQRIDLADKLAARLVMKSIDPDGAEPALFFWIREPVPIVSVLQMNVVFVRVTLFEWRNADMEYVPPNLAARLTPWIIGISLPFRPLGHEALRVLPLTRHSILLPGFFAK
jgi:hypothetical protein